MNIAYCVFRRFLLVLLGVALTGLVSSYSRDNWLLTSAAGALVFLPVGLWLFRPKELRKDSLEESVAYSLIPTLTAVILAVTSLSYLVHKTPAQYGIWLTVVFVSIVVLAHALHITLRKQWVRQGFRPRWANGVVFVLSAILTGLAAAIARGSSQSGPDFGKRFGSSIEDDSVYNPATGLKMQGGIGGFDGQGNTWGQSNSGFDNGDKL